jgi:hypothetical protein
VDRYRRVCAQAESAGLASVTLRSEDGKLHHAPNRILLEEVVSKTPERGR